MSSPSDAISFRWLIINGLIVIAIIGGGMYIVSTNQEMADVASEAFWGVFTFFTTPFILETSVALFAILLVGIINQRRIDREGDGWVLLPRQPAKSNTQDQQPPEHQQRDSAPIEP
jgi:hypothetical protein